MNNRILLVEDSKALRNFLSQQLGSLGCHVVSAGSVAETQQVLSKENDFVCAVLDYCLPDGENGEVIDLVLESNLKVVVLTSYFSGEIREHFLSKGVLEYILKDSMCSVSYLIPFIKRIMNNVKHHALVVDDSRTMRTNIVQLLDHQYIRTTEAEDGDDAISKLAANTDITFVITDYAMPNKDGVEMIKEVRQLYNQNQLAILGLSGSSDRTLTAQFLKAGANDFLYKPFNQEEFYCRIHQMLNMKEATDELYRMANQDVLTGLWNRRYLFEHDGEHSGDRNIAMLDIDYFKKVNDSHGHDAGDLVLIEVAKAVKNSFKDGIAVRFGGEEFCILQHGNYDSFVARLDTMRQEIEQIRVSHLDTQIQVTISIGATNTEGNLDEQIKLADQRLYDSKEGGRNRITSR
ncbi:GGDEF domain-containing response regulator [Vibrio marisflavi]|uniref:diguanylate cyclase n=1 Tax=Vibrio marisflavi CECT 7928 TaxID=634439 RepID=A0ABM9A6R5_9VIBR|nr:response regulator [Vibrio marisflavi]CAH0541015.1 Regulator of RpoS [Vibrio marisflavi CECT 7928]